jgi:hypothetical protein
LTTLGLAITATGAGAATTPAAGRAQSTVSLVQLEAGGHTLSLGELSLVADTMDGVLSSVTVTPVTADGTAYGKQTITPATSPTGVPAVSSPNALTAFAALTSPSVDVSASTTPATQAGTTSLGSVRLLGLDIDLDGELSTGASVTASGGAVGDKTVTLRDVALPSIADILGALGLDLSALPVDTLTTLLSQLDLVTGALSTAQAAVDGAQADVDAAVADLASLTSDLTTAEGALTTAQATFATATTTLETALADAAFVGTIADYEALAQLAKDALALINPALPDAYTDYLAAQTAVATAQTAVDAAQALVDAAQALLDTLESTLTTFLSALQGVALDLMDATPLLELDSLELSTSAQARTAKAGGQTAKIVGGTITGLRVLGTDVLDAALGDSTLDLSELAGSVATQVNDLVADLTGTLSSVLSSVPGLAALDVPAPTISLLSKSTSTSVSDGFGNAETLVTGLAIVLPAITVPLPVALPGAADLPALVGVTQSGGVLTTAPVRIGLLTLRDQALYRPAVTTTTGGPATPGTPGTPIADTGLPAGVALLALTVLGLGLMLRRRLIATA